MEFTFETDYNQKAITAMAQALRKTVRKKSSRRSHIFGIAVIVLSLLLTLPGNGEKFVVDVRTVVTWTAMFAILIVLIFEDELNGFIAQKRMLTGNDKSICVFDEEKYVSAAPIGKTEWSYGNIKGLAETEDYFVFIFDRSHAQIYDKHGLTGGTADEFRQFITGKTGMEIVQMK